MTTPARAASGTSSRIRSRARARAAQTAQAASTIRELRTWLTRRVLPMYRLSVRRPSMSMRPAP